MSSKSLSPVSLSLSLQHLQQQADAAFAVADYAQAAACYEQLVEAVPSVMIFCWRLGLACLLQEQEEEAQLVWMMAMTDGTPEELDQWQQELCQVLEQEAQQQTEKENTKHAWLIRQHLYEIAPTHVNNLLHLARLCSKEPQLETQIAIIFEWLSSEHQEVVSDLDADLLLETLQQLLEDAPENLAVFKFAEACLPYVQDSEVWIQLLLDHAGQLGKLLQNTYLAHCYTELCLQLDPNHSEVITRLAGYYQDLGKYKEGIELARRYYDIAGQTSIEKLGAISLLLRGLMSAGSKWQEADALLQQQSALIYSLLSEHRSNPDLVIDASLVCAAMFFPPYFQDHPQNTSALRNGLSQFYQAGLSNQVDQQVEQSEIKEYQPYPLKKRGKNLRENKKIRIGYIARHLRRHSVGWLSRWVFEHYDRERFEVYAYLNQQSKIQDFSKQWFTTKATQSCAFTGDTLGIANAIQEDEIDILIDLDSLTCDSTYSVMALKPAPVQATWLGLDASGLPAIDYFIADPYVLPEQAQNYYNEKIWRLPQTYIAVDGFEVGIPTLRRDHLNIPADAVTYLSSQFAFKRHPDTIRLQMRVLQQVPNSYFLIKGLGDQEGLQQVFGQIAEEMGVSFDRLRFLPHDRNEETHRANLAIADVVLDTFPYNGATTTLETLWMGIPMVTRVGQQFAARNSYTMMVNAGINEGIAWTDEDYVEWGVRLGKDEALRQQISWKLRQSRQTAPLWNAKQFTRDMENAYEQMWQIYLESR